jgi:hypothetical protein
VIQVLPAMWIWLALLDLKAHLLYGDSFHVVHGPVVILLVTSSAPAAHGNSRPGAPGLCSVGLMTER